MWTIYVDESFLRLQMSWFLPDPQRVLPGLHPDEWDGRAMVLNSGTTAFQSIEPIWRKLSVIHDGSLTPETAATRSIELFAQWVEVVLPVFVSDPVNGNRNVVLANPVRGSLTAAVTGRHIERAVQILRSRISETWSVDALARATAMSRAHLSRLFVIRTGLPPMRFLSEIRLTEFTRLIEETDMSVASAAHAVGWTDPRIASAWFYRRFGVVPSKYRLTPHPDCTDGGKIGTDSCDEPNSFQRELVD